MKKIMAIAAFAAVLPGLASAEETVENKEGWKLSVNASALMSLNTYSSNWDGSEAGSLSWAAKIDAEAEKQLAEKLNNRNIMKLAFGQTRQQDAETGKWGAFFKSTDQIDIETLWKLTLGGKVSPFASGRFESRFYDTEDPERDRWINPISLTEMLGASAELVKKDLVDWFARLGAGARQMIDRNRPEPDLSFRETHVTNDGGIEFVTELKAGNSAKWLEFKSLLKVYEALISTRAAETDGTPAEGWWRYPHVNWESDLSLNVTRYIMLNLYVQLLYDREIDSSPRFKETFSLGLTLAFGN